MHATTWSDVRELVKAPLVGLVLFNVTAGFALGAAGPLDWLLLAHALLGTSLMAASASALNQTLEAKSDARMTRTSYRPVPSGRVPRKWALGIGLTSCAIGSVWLWVAVGRLMAVGAVLVVLSYVCVYTPLKSRTSLHVPLGTIPFALTPLGGWTAATGSAWGAGWSLVLILVLWQGPPCFSISWIYRKDFAAAGIVSPCVDDESGERSSRLALRHSLALTAASGTPFVLGLSGLVYLGGAVLLNLLLLTSAIRFLRIRNDERARQLFWTTLIYLPLLLSLMVMDKQ